MVLNNHDPEQKAARRDNQEWEEKKDQGMSKWSESDYQWAEKEPKDRKRWGRE